MPSPSSQKITAIGNAVAFIFMITANCLSIFLPLNGKTQMQLSEQYPNLFTPAGFTFSVWSIIYTLLFGFIIYQFYVLLVAHHRDKTRVRLISPLFVGVCLCNAGWLFAWHYQFTTVSVIIMLAHLYFLIRIHERLKLAIAWSPLAPKLWLEIPFSIYLGWICVATIANITAWCVSKGFTFSFIPPRLWTIIMLLAALLIGMFYVFTRNNKFLALTIVWAFYGIIARQKEVSSDDSHIIVLAASIALSILLLIIVLNSLRRRVPEYTPNLPA